MRVKVSVQPKTIDIDEADYQERWEEHCDDQSDEDTPEGYPEIDEDWLIALVAEEFNDGERDLSETFDGEAIEVERVS